MSLTILHFNNPYMYFTELTQKIRFDLPDTYYQTFHEPFPQSMKTRRHPDGKRTWNVSLGSVSRVGLKGARLAPPVAPATTERFTTKREDFSPSSSTESSDDDVESADHSNSDELTSSTPDVGITGP
jgi:hypothetical protein